MRRFFCQVENTWSEVELVEMFYCQLLFLLKYTFPTNKYFFHYDYIFVLISMSCFSKAHWTFFLYLIPYNFCQPQRHLSFLIKELCRKTKFQEFYLNKSLLLRNRMHRFFFLPPRLSNSKMFGSSVKRQKLDFQFPDTDIKSGRRKWNWISFWWEI